jgi:integrase
MPRKARNERLETRTARLKLLVRREPYFFTFQEGRALGYRRLGGGKGGTWIARRYDPLGGRTYQALGDADDYMEADGADILTFAQAQAKAGAWFTKAARGTGKVVAPVTVGDALDAYLQDYVARGGKGLAQTRQAIEAHIRPAFGSKPVAALTPAVLRSWLHAVAAAAARLRAGKADVTPKLGRVATDADAKRARRASANRVLTILKAALNHAFREGHAPSDDAWRKVRPFAKVDAARIRYLTDDESRRLLNACPADLRALVTAALLTGCRYGELVKLTCSDVDLPARVLTIRMSKSGKPRSVVLTDEAREFFGRLTAGKPGGALVLTRETGEAWGTSHQFRPLREACAVATIAPAISFHILRHTHASRLAQRGVPMSVIAAQLGNEERICAKHYAHLSPGYVADTVRQAFGTLGVLTETNVLPIRGAA